MREMRDAALEVREWERRDERVQRGGFFARIVHWFDTAFVKQGRV